MPDYQPLIPCGHCGHNASGEVVHTAARGYWLRCTGCGMGSFRTNEGENTWPGAKMGAEVAHLPPDVAAAWCEARSSGGVGAHTASEMMCRKILMHIAVDKAGSAEGKRFIEYVDDLDNAGFIAVGLKPVVDIIRSRGNVANHELPPSSKEHAEVTVRITEHLLQSTYSLPSLASG